MIEIKTIRGKKIWLYDASKDKGMSDARMNEVHKYWLADVGIGANPSDILGHFATLEKFLISNDVSAAMQELQNLYTGLIQMHQGISSKSLCFVCLVHRYDNEIFEDYSEHAIQQLSERILKEVRPETVTYLVNDIKKKLIPS